MATGHDGQENRKNKIESKLSLTKLRRINDETLHSDAITIAWKAVSSTVGSKIMGDRGAPVPYLTEATKYGLFNVLVKERRRIVDKLTGRPATIHWSAPLENILPPNMKLEEFRLQNRAVLVDEDSKALVHYHFKSVDNPEKKNSKKELKPCDVEIKLTQVQHYKMEYDYPETAVDLTKHFTGVDDIDRIYLITEVFVADAVLMNVTVGEKRYQWDSSTLTPIGFVFVKCEISPEGMLTYGQEVDRKKAVKYNWVQSDEKSEKVKDATRETLHKAAS